MEVLDRKCQILGEGPIPVDDSQHGPLFAVRRSTLPASGALSAGCVDLSHYAPTLQVLWAGGDNADELVPQDSPEGVVAALQLEIGIADAGLEHTDECLTGDRFRDGNVISHAEVAVFQPEPTHRLHSTSPVPSPQRNRADHTIAKAC